VFLRTRAQKLAPVRIVDNGICAILFFPFAVTRC